MQKKSTKQSLIRCLHAMIHLLQEKAQQTNDQTQYNRITFEIGQTEALLEDVKRLDEF